MGAVALPGTANGVTWLRWVRHTGDGASTPGDGPVPARPLERHARAAT
ncbi:hypothetical protein STVIR_5326 [Streptomyces viridochromogenes Tue57]|uniref:Uncharacterized protein n=1 Tax=Streptomyces viridochromogenes Tue57 TaxID=1160705 RepID=L8PC37_STRVR|nr:hypothetical protein STVIR_5326 [Streptomyces viridochromogenes Tue57]